MTSTVLEYSPLIDVVESAYRNFLVYGKSGSGKTHSIGTMDGSVLILNQEKRLGGLHAQFKDNTKEISRFHVMNVYNYPDVFSHLMQIADQLEAQSSFPKWIVGDSLSAIAFKILENELVNYKDGRQAYGEVATKVLRLIKRFCGLPTNFVGLCMLDAQPDVEQVNTLCPYFPGKALANRVPYEFDCVYLLDKTLADKEGKSQRFFQVEGDARALAKNCAHMPPRIEPSYAHILQTILK